MTTAARIPSAAAWPRDGIYKLPDLGGWIVPSESLTGAYRLVIWHTRSRGPVGFECSCPAGAIRGTMGASDACRHVRAVADAERKDGYPPRSTGPVNVSALCD